MYSILYYKKYEVRNKRGAIFDITTRVHFLYSLEVQNIYE